MSPPEQTAGTASPFDPFGQWKAVRDSSMEAWSKIMLDFVHSDDYARASAQWLDIYLTTSQIFQQALDQAMTQTLRQYKIPSTVDFTRLAERMANLELRLDDLDARVDEILRLLKGLVGTTAAAQRKAENGEQAAKPAEGAAERLPVRESDAREKSVEHASAPVGQTGGGERFASEPVPAAEPPGELSEAAPKGRAHTNKARSADRKETADSKRQEQV
jgi:hypothetical protein